MIYVDKIARNTPKKVILTVAKSNLPSSFAMIAGVGSANGDFSSNFALFSKKFV